MRQILKFESKALLQVWGEVLSCFTPVTIEIGVRKPQLVVRRQAAVNKPAISLRTMRQKSKRHQLALMSLSSVNAGTRVLVTNLHPEITEEDLVVLFEAPGLTVLNANVDKDAEGRSLVNS